jgi:hypothetical protein
MTAAERIGHAILTGWGIHGLHVRPATSLGAPTYVIGWTRPGIPEWKRVSVHGRFPNDEWEHPLLDAAGVPHYEPTP